MITSLPPYSTKADIRSRLAGIVKTLGESITETAAANRTAGIYLLQVANTWHLAEVTAPRDKDALIADYASLRREIQSQSTLQSNALAAIKVRNSRSA